MEYIDVRDLTVEKAEKILREAGIKIYRIESGQGPDFDKYGMITPDTVPEELLHEEMGGYFYDNGSFFSIVARVVQDLLDRIEKLEKQTK